MICQHSRYVKIPADRPFQHCGSLMPTVQLPRCSAANGWQTGSTHGALLNTVPHCLVNQKAAAPPSLTNTEPILQTQYGQPVGQPSSQSVTRSM